MDSWTPMALSRQSTLKGALRWQGQDQPVQEERGTEIPVRELPVREPARETSSPDGYDLYDFFTVEDRVEADDRYARSESLEVRPRVRVYGCCLPITLGMLLVFIGAATVLGNLVIQAL